VRSLPDYTPVNDQPRLPITHRPQYDHDGGFDVIVIGSGAGGGVVAAQVAKAGLSVLVIEKGPYYHESDYVLQEGAAARRNMERGGTFLNEEGTMGFMAGSLIGGGTSINYSASLQVKLWMHWK
jgi:choline dehydrogenase-like flavoprotein